MKIHTFIKYFSYLIIVIFLLKITTNTSYAQAKEIDSLYNLLKNSKKDTVKSKLYIKISYKIMSSYPDSALLLANKALEIENSFEKNSTRRADCYNRIGDVFFYKGNYNIALNYYKQAVTIYEEFNDISAKTRTFNNIGHVFYYKGRYSEAMEYYRKALKIREKTGTEKQIASCYNNMGMIHFVLGNYSWAEEYYRKSLSLKEKTGYKAGMAFGYNNLGDIYLAKNNFDSAGIYYNKALEIRTGLNDTRNIAYTYNSIGKLYAASRMSDSAYLFFNKSVKIRNKLNDKEGIASTYGEISQLYLNEKKLQKSIQYAEKELEIGRKINALPKIEQAYELLANAYEQLKDLKTGYKYYKLFRETKDSILSNEKNKQIGEIEAQFRMEKQQQEAVRNKRLLEKQQEEIKKRRLQSSGLISGLIVSIITTLIILIFVSVTAKANKKLKAQNIEISKNRQEITDSIMYASQIQHAILPSEENLKRLFKDYFVFHRPRDIVSGDFYWTKEIKNFAVLAVADCTGHGVPGAFMSMLGSSFLNEVVNRRSLDSTGETLDRLRSKIKKSLKQKGETGEQQDGMDLALYIIDRETLELQFSGAYNPLYIVRKPENKDDNCELICIKADRQPIAIYYSEKKFTTHKIQLQKGDCLYTFSDGFTDQFGGEKNKKFTSKRFKKLLVSIAKFHPEKQKNILSETFDNWKKGNEQLDDVLVFGVKI